MNTFEAEESDTLSYSERLVIKLRNREKAITLLNSQLNEISTKNEAEIHSLNKQIEYLKSENEDLSSKYNALFLLEKGERKEFKKQKFIKDLCNKIKSIEEKFERYKLNYDNLLAKYQLLINKNS